jgi:protein-tyrosine-phosphatase
MNIADEIIAVQEKHNKRVNELNDNAGKVFGELEKKHKEEFTNIQNKFNDDLLVINADYESEFKIIRDKAEQLMTETLLKDKENKGNGDEKKKANS